LKKFQKYHFALLFIILLGCNKSKEISEDNLKKVQIAPPIIRLDSFMVFAKSPQEINQILNKNIETSEAYFETPRQGFSELSGKLFNFFKSPELRQFYQETTSNKGISIDPLEKELNAAFNRIKADYPDFKAPKIFTSFTGFAGKDLLVNDSTIVIGLEYFGGKNAKYRPQVFDYQINKYQKEYIVPSILNQMAIKYAAIDPADKSMLADMLFYGKCYQFTKKMLPAAHDSLIIAFTNAQLESTEISQEMVWGHVIDEKLLYESNPFKKAKYLDERPNTQEISPDCPGLIGRWLGWKIIKKYLENNPEVSVKSLLGNPKAQDIFQKSKYKGKADEVK
jgi:hypothetical protein